MVGMTLPRADLWVENYHIRTLTGDDVGLIVEGTSEESGAALWGPVPAGPYSHGDAVRALQEWDPDRPSQVSFGVLVAERMVAALGLMPDDGGGAELAYWVRSSQRERGIATLSVQVMTAWAHEVAGLSPIWLEIDPAHGASRTVATRAGYAVQRKQSDHCWIWTHA
jgi:RimJ/RimL family protein N-acetyltransferase